MGVVFGERCAERGQLGPIIPVLRRLDPRGRQNFGMPGFDRLPAFGHLVVPGQRFGAVFQPHGLPIARHLPGRVGAQRGRTDHNRGGARRAKGFVKPPQGLVPHFLAGEAGVLALIGQDAFGRVTDQDRVAHSGHEPGIIWQRMLHVIGHVLEEYRALARLIEDHVTNARVVGRVARFGLEMLEGPVPRAQVVVIHEGLMQNGQIAAFTHDAFEGGRDGAGVAPERVECHAREAVAAAGNCQRGTCA